MQSSLYSKGVTQMTNTTKGKVIIEIDLKHLPKMEKAGFMYKIKEIRAE